MNGPLWDIETHSPLDGDADRHEDAARVGDRREGVKEELVELGVDPAGKSGMSSMYFKTPI